VRTVLVSVLVLVLVLAEGRVTASNVRGVGAFFVFHKCFIDAKCRMSV